MSHTTFDESTLPAKWTQPPVLARMHLLRAHRANRAVILRRKPSKRVHVMSWDTETDEITHGSWFSGRIYGERCDLSWDGKWMVYLAMGSKGQTWNGICQPPWLKTVADVSNEGTWAGGGYFSHPNKLIANTNRFVDEDLSKFHKSALVPFEIEAVQSGGEVFPILDYRLERDGWKSHEAEGIDHKVKLKHSSYATFLENGSSWSWQPTPAHPVLRMFFRGYLVAGYTFEFRLEGSDLLDVEVDWATWDAKGDLLVARAGGVARYSLEAIASGKPDFEANFEHLSPPESTYQERQQAREAQLHFKESRDDLAMPSLEEISPSHCADAQEKLAAEYFLGKSQNQALEMFEESFPFFAPSLLHMGSKAFVYYFPAALAQLEKMPPELFAPLAHELLTQLKARMAADATFAAEAKESVQKLDTRIAEMENLHRFPQ